MKLIVLKVLLSNNCKLKFGKKMVPICLPLTMKLKLTLGECLDTNNQVSSLFLCAGLTWNDLCESNLNPVL